MDLHKGVSPRGVKKSHTGFVPYRDNNDEMHETEGMGAGPPGARQSCTESSEDKIWKIKKIKVVTKNSTIQSYT